MNKRIGDAGEILAAKLLRDKGYAVELIGGNYPVVDLIVHGQSDFRVSVKTSNKKHHVRLGRDTSLEQIRDDDFVFAFLPIEPDQEIGFSGGEYRLLIMPGQMVREDALAVHHAYLASKSTSGVSRTGSAGVMVKGYSNKPIHVQTWVKWMAFEDRWELLPAA